MDKVMNITSITDESGDYMGFVGAGIFDHDEFASRIAWEFDREIEIEKITHGLARWRPVNPHSPDYEYWKQMLEPASEKGRGVFETTEFYYG